MAKPTNRELANARLSEAQDVSADTEQRNVWTLEAITYALLAVADEVSALRDAVGGAEDALKDQDGFGVGNHIRFISDSLEKIAKR